MDKKGLAAETAIVIVILAVVALVLIYSLRIIPEEGRRQQTCQAHLGFCAEESACPSGTNRIDYDCANEKPCCIGVVAERRPSPGASETPSAAETAPASAAPDSAAERRRVEELQARLETARREGSLERISAEYDAAKALITARFAQYRPPASAAMTRENTPFNYNMVKSFEQLTLAQEAAFRVASEERRQYAASQDYFKWMCSDWLLLTRAYLSGYYSRSTYNPDNWLANKERVFRDYAAHVGTSQSCKIVSTVTRSDDLDMCKDSWTSESFRSLALAQDTPTEEVWGSCYIYRAILKYPLIDFEDNAFTIEGTNFFLPRALQVIFAEAS